MHLSHIERAERSTGPESFHDHGRQDQVEHRRLLLGNKGWRDRTGKTYLTDSALKSLSEADASQSMCRQISASPTKRGRVSCDGGGCGFAIRMNECVADHPSTERAWG
jgi:hypothetical protein